MSLIQRNATKREWDHVAEYGHGPKIARDVWCVRSLVWSSSITPRQAGAARRLAGRLERRQGQGGGGTLEHVDGGGGDIHDVRFDAAKCGEEADSAIAFVWTNLPADEGRGKRVSALFAAMSTPHLTTAAAARLAGYGYGGKGRDLFIGDLIVSLELLVTHFDAVDADRERKLRRGC